MFLGDCMLWTTILTGSYYGTQSFFGYNEPWIVIPMLIGLFSMFVAIRIVWDYYKHPTMKKTFLLQVEGNIGSGKSTFLKVMETQYGEYIDIVYEPVKEWQTVCDEDGTNLLNHFYQNMKRWGYTMQNYVFLTRVFSLLSLKHSNKKLRIAERSIYTDYYIFAKMCYEHGNMSLMEYTMYKKWFNVLEEQYESVVKPDAIVYIKTDPSVAMERMKKRGRGEEVNVSMEYLEELSNKHDEMMKQMKCPVYVLDGNIEFEKDIKRQQEMIEHLKLFLSQFRWNEHWKEWNCLNPVFFFD
jgi:deoxyadenosine/deoxycytidine kinase